MAIAVGTDDGDASGSAPSQSSVAPDRGDLLAERAWKLYVDGDDDGARTAARRARKEGSKNPLAFIVSGRIAVEDENGQMALEYAEDALELDEWDAYAVDIHAIRGDAFFLLEKDELAVKAFEKALSSSSSKSERSEILSRKAVAQIRMGRHGDAMKSCLDAFDADPGMDSDRRAAIHCTALAVLLENMDSISELMVLSRVIESHPVRQEFKNDLQSIVRDEIRRLEVLKMKYPNMLLLRQARLVTVLGGIVGLIVMSAISSPSGFAGWLVGGLPWAGAVYIWYTQSRALRACKAGVKEVERIEERLEEAAELLE